MRSNKGFGLIEIVIVSSIISVAVVSLSYVLVLSNRLSSRASDEIRANFIAEEGIEAIRFLRDKSWTTDLSVLVPNTDYFVILDTSTGQWSISTTEPGLLGDLFRRTIRVDSVYRDPSFDIVASGGTIDPETLRITSLVTWQYGTTSLETYLSNMFNN